MEEIGEGTGREQTGLEEKCKREKGVKKRKEENIII